MCYHKMKLHSFLALVVMLILLIPHALSEIIKMDEASPTISFSPSVFEVGEEVTVSIQNTGDADRLICYFWVGVGDAGGTQTILDKDGNMLEDGQIRIPITSSFKVDTSHFASIGLNYPTIILYKGSEKVFEKSYYIKMKPRKASISVIKDYKEFKIEVKDTHDPFVRNRVNYEIYIDDQKYHRIFNGESNYSEISDFINNRGKEEIDRSFTLHPSDESVFSEGEHTIKVRYQVEWIENVRFNDGYNYSPEWSDWSTLNYTVGSELKDSDGDGLPDEWEINGVDVDDDGKIDIDLPGMGASPNIPDVFVEVDYMYKPAVEYTGVLGWFYESEPEIKLLPNQDVFDTVMAEYLKHGIQLHIDAGPDSIMNPKTGEKWGKRSKSTSFVYSDSTPTSRFVELCNNNLAEYRQYVFRCCLCVNKIDDSRISGRAYTPGQILVIADAGGGVLKDKRVATGTFMHELGHTLGLLHGGDEDTNYKPNYLSIMNYLFQQTGLKGPGNMNYSEFVLPKMNIQPPNEVTGIDPEGITKGFGGRWELYYKGNTKNTDLGFDISGQSIDFDEDGEYKAYSSASFYLEDYVGDGIYINSSIRDWDHLQFKAGLIGNLNAGDRIVEDDSKLTKEWTIEEAKAAGLYWTKGDCIIESIEPEMLEMEEKERYISIKVANMSTGQTNPRVTVDSPLLDQKWSNVINLAESESKVIEIPVKESIESGPALIKASLHMENGNLREYESLVRVPFFKAIEMNVGDSINIKDDIDNGVVYNSENKKVVNITSDMILAREQGTANVNIYFDEDFVGKISVIVKDRETKEIPKTGDLASPGLWLLLVVVGCFSLIYGIRQRKTK